MLRHFFSACARHRRNTGVRDGPRLIPRRRDEYDRRHQATHEHTSPRRHSSALRSAASRERRHPAKPREASRILLGITILWGSTPSPLLGHNSSHPGTSSEMQSLSCSSGGSLPKRTRCPKLQRHTLRKQPAAVQREVPF